MKIIQSYWSPPTMQNNLDYFGRHSGGWLSSKYHAMSWALSCLTLRNYYQEVELVTDLLGVKWLIEELELPYTKYSTSLEKLPLRNASLWALGKIFSFTEQHEPFMHVDSDVYIWSRFDESLEMSRLFAQNVEYEFSNSSNCIYAPAVERLKTKLVHVPEFFRELFERRGGDFKIEAVNTGIVGGRDYEFLRTFSEKIFEFLDKNKSVTFESSDMSLMEQYTLFQISKTYGIDVSYLISEQESVGDFTYSSVIQINLAPIVKKYVHLIGFAKRKIEHCIQLAARLKYQFPSYYERIVSLYNDEGKPTTKIIPNLDKRSYSPFARTERILQKLDIVPSPKIDDDYLILISNTLIALSNHRLSRLLNDVYTIEKYQYLAIKNIQLKEVNVFYSYHIVDALYKMSVFEFMKLKFKINKPVIDILTLRFPEISDTSLNEILDNSELTNLDSSEDIYMAVLDQCNSARVMPLSGWHILLAYFDEDGLSGEELIKIITSLKLEIDDIQMFALSFLTINSISLNYLVRVM